MLEFLTFAKILQNSENIEMQETIISLTKQINLLLDKTSTNHQHVADNETNCSRDILGKNDEAQSVKNLNAIVSQAHPKQGSNDSIINSQILVQVISLSLSGTFCRSKLKLLLA